MILKCCNNILKLLLITIAAIFSLLATTASSNKIPLIPDEPLPPALPATTPADIFSLFSKIFSSSAAAYDDNDDYIPYRSDEHDPFTWNLLKSALTEEQQQSNIMISPFSVQLVLTLLAEAAGNNTQTQRELLNTLSNLHASDNLRGFCKKILTSMKKENPHYTLNLETKLFADAVQVCPQQKYTEILYQFYETKIERVNFTQPERAAECINAWTNHVTHGRIPQLVNADAIRDNVLLIANVIYFHGRWRREFAAAYNFPFYKAAAAAADAKSEIRAELMDLTDEFYYHDSSSLDAKIIRLPYKGKRFSMFIVLPKTKDGLQQLLVKMKSKDLKGLQWMMEKSRVKVTIPKFKFAYKADIKDTLQKLGINEIFTDHASLPGLSEGYADVVKKQPHENSISPFNGGKLSVSNIYQKSGIDVNERGTEAVAATVVDVTNRFGSGGIEFKADHPFMFFIEEEPSGIILFAGKVLDPTT